MKNEVLGFCAIICLSLIAVACGSNSSGSSDNTAAAPSCPVGQYWLAQYNTCVNNTPGQCSPGYANGSTQCVGTTAVGSQCGAGLVYTYQGCLAQGFCPIGQAQYGQTCIQAMAINGVNTGVYPNGAYPTGAYPPGYGYPQAYPTGYMNNGYPVGYPGYYPRGYGQYRPAGFLGVYVNF